jgi:hypothetical protein
MLDLLEVEIFACGARTLPYRLSRFWRGFNYLYQAVLRQTSRVRNALNAVPEPGGQTCSSSDSISAAISSSPRRYTQSISASITMSKTLPLGDRIPAGVTELKSIWLLKIPHCLVFNFHHLRTIKKCCSNAYGVHYWNNWNVSRISSVP